jgi:hypothetical protein
LRVDQSIVDIHVRQHSFVGVWPASGWDNAYLFAEHELFVVTLCLIGKRLAVFWGVYAKITNGLPIAESDGIAVEDGGLGSVGWR